MPRILVIEDEPPVLLGLVDNLELEGYAVLTATDGEEGLRVARECGPDLIVLDLMLPKVDGFEVCRILREEGVTIPIVMLTARGQEGEKVRGLDLGADDYITKPFGISEFLARVRAALRRGMIDPARVEQYRFGSLRVDVIREEVFQGRRKVSLRPLEFAVLHALIQRRGEPVSREELLHEIWGYDAVPDTRTVDTHVARIRRKIEENPEHPQHILSVWGKGYKFEG